MFTPQTEWADRISRAMPRTLFHELWRRYKNSGPPYVLLADEFSKVQAVEESQALCGWLQDAVVQCIAMSHLGRSVLRNEIGASVSSTEAEIIERAVVSVDHNLAFEQFLFDSGIDVEHWLDAECAICRHLASNITDTARSPAPDLVPIVREVARSLQTLETLDSNSFDEEDARRRRVYKKFLRRKPRHVCHPLRKPEYCARLGLKLKMALKKYYLTDSEVAQMLGMSSEGYQNLDHPSATPSELTTFASVTGYVDIAFRNRNFEPLSEESDYLVAAINGLCYGEEDASLDIESYVNDAINSIRNDKNDWDKL